MKSVAMSGSRRASVGKKDAAEIRRSGNVPCVLYGGSDQVAFQLGHQALEGLINSPEVRTVDLDIDGNKYTAILQAYQAHPVTDHFVHVDFLQILPGKAVTLSLPVQFVGNSAGVKAGGKLIKKLRKLKVRGMLEKMPDMITIDIENLNIGQAIRVVDMNIEGLSFLDNKNATIITIQTTRNVATPAEEAKAAKK
jgi:large subunit ribosomal protein L25